jgi:hypothetical protein
MAHVIEQKAYICRVRCDLCGDECGYSCANAEFKAQQMAFADASSRGAVTVRSGSQYVLCGYCRRVTAWAHHEREAGDR